jgi:aldehyde dehydrogenase (NAD+)
VARVVHLETGKSFREALGETDGAAALGFFMAGEGQRLYGRTTTSGVAHKYALTVRQPVGVAGLIIAANTPIANVAWKVFPRSSAETPPCSRRRRHPGTPGFGKLAHAAGLGPECNTPGPGGGWGAAGGILA